MCVCEGGVWYWLASKWVEINFPTSVRRLEPFFLLIAHFQFKSSHFQVSSVCTCVCVCWALISPGLGRERGSVTALYFLRCLRELEAKKGDTEGEKRSSQVRVARSPVARSGEVAGSLLCQCIMH